MCRQKTACEICLAQKCRKQKSHSDATHILDVCQKRRCCFDTCGHNGATTTVYCTVTPISNQAKIPSLPKLRPIAVSNLPILHSALCTVANNCHHMSEIFTGGLCD